MSKRGKGGQWKTCSHTSDSHIYEYGTRVTFKSTPLVSLIQIFFSLNIFVVTFQRLYIILPVVVIPWCTCFGSFLFCVPVQYAAFNKTYPTSVYNLKAVAHQHKLHFWPGVSKNLNWFLLFD